MKISAIVPVYNRSRVVLDALESIAAQQLPPSEVLVIDDASTDGTPEVVAQWIQGRKFPFPVRLIRQTKAGAAAARNLGAAQADGCDLLAFLDSDDLWEKDYLERMVRGLASAPDAVAASCDRAGLDLQTNKTKITVLKRMQGAATTTILMEGPPGMPNTIIRSKAFHALGGFDPTLSSSQDFDLFLRLSVAGPWSYVPGVLVTVRENTHQKFGGEVQISRRNDRSLVRAKVVDRFIHHHNGKAVIPERLWRKQLALLWFRAGRTLAGAQQSEQALACFNRAIEILPFQWRARWYRAVLLGKQKPAK